MSDARTPQPIGRLSLDANLGANLVMLPSLITAAMWFWADFDFGLRQLELIAVVVILLCAAGWLR